jgi:nickel transport protein
LKKVILFLLIASSLFAHKINLFVTNEENGVNIYSYFASGDPCINCKLIIKNGGNIILEDTLNEKGKYLFPSKYKEIEITVNASGGHMVKQDVIVDNIKNELLETHLKEEKEDEYIKILISLFLIAVIFYILKKVKRKKQ